MQYLSRLNKMNYKVFLRNILEMLRIIVDRISYDFEEFKNKNV